MKNTIFQEENTLLLYILELVFGIVLCVLGYFSVKKWNALIGVAGIIVCGIILFMGHDMIATIGFFLFGIILLIVMGVERAYSK